MGIAVSPLKFAIPLSGYGGLQVRFGTTEKVTASTHHLSGKFKEHRPKKDEHTDLSLAQVHTLAFFS
jgi:hypothetical protein